MANALGRTSAIPFALRWGVTVEIVRYWARIEDPQWLLLVNGMRRRERGPVIDRQCGPVVGLSDYVQEQGIFISDLVEHSGLSAQHLHRLAKSDNTHRLRDLVAGVSLLVIARNKAALRE